MLTGEFPIEEIEDRDLYLKYVKSQDKLVPLEKMIYREEKNLETHRRKMDACGSKSKVWEWRYQLAINAQKRLDYWKQLNDKN